VSEKIFYIVIEKISLLKKTAVKLSQIKHMPHNNKFKNFRKILKC